MPVCMHAKSLQSWTVARQVPVSLEFSRQHYWSRLPCPPPGDLPDSVIELTSPEAPALQVDSSLRSHQGSPKGMPTPLLVLTKLT